MNKKILQSLLLSVILVSCVTIPRIDRKNSRNSVFSKELQDWQKIKYPKTSDTIFLGNNLRLGNELSWDGNQGFLYIDTSIKNLWYSIRGEEIGTDTDNILSSSDTTQWDTVGGWSYYTFDPIIDGGSLWKVGRNKGHIGTQLSGKGWRNWAGDVIITNHPDHKHKLESLTKPWFIEGSIPAPNVWKCCLAIDLNRGRFHRDPLDMSNPINTQTLNAYGTDSERNLALNRMLTIPISDWSSDHGEVGIGGGIPWNIMTVICLDSIQFQDSINTHIKIFKDSLVWVNDRWETQKSLNHVFGWAIVVLIGILIIFLTVHKKI